MCVCVCVCVFSHFSHLKLFVTLWTVACQAPLSMGFCRQEYWSGLPCPPPGNLPTQGLNALQVDSLPSEPPEKIPWTRLKAFSFLFFNFKFYYQTTVCKTV